MVGVRNRGPLSCGRGSGRGGCCLTAPNKRRVVGVGKRGPLSCGS